MSLPELASFTKLSEGTKEDFAKTQAHFAAAATPEKMADRMLQMVEDLKGAVS